MNRSTKIIKCHHAIVALLLLGLVTNVFADQNPVQTAAAPKTTNVIKLTPEQEFMSKYGVSEQSSSQDAQNKKVAQNNEPNIPNTPVQTEKKVTTTPLTTPATAAITSTTTPQTQTPQPQEPYVPISEKNIWNKLTTTPAQTQQVEEIQQVQQQQLHRNIYQ